MEHCAHELGISSVKMATFYPHELSADSIELNLFDGVGIHIYHCSCLCAVPVVRYGRDGISINVYVQYQ